MPTVLIIEDDELLRKMLAAALALTGYSVLEAADGKTGLAAFRNHPADVVVTDIVMPDVEGFAVIMTLRQESPETKIVAISGAGRGLIDYLRIARLMGAAAVLAKPFSIEALTQTVRSLVPVVATGGLCL